MPFTFSHPAIVLPLLRKYKNHLSATGLIVGSITPDFEAFVNIGDAKIYGHTWLGMFWFDLPIAIFLSLLFHTVVRRPLLANLPLVLQRKFHGYVIDRWPAYFKDHFWVVISSILIGIASHLLWDAATHLNLLEPNNTNESITVGSVTLSVVLQYVCSVLGMGYILFYVVGIPQTPVATAQHRSKVYWPIMVIIMLLALSTERHFASSESRFEHNRSDYCISSTLISLVLTSAIIGGITKGKIIANHG